MKKEIKAADLVAFEKEFSDSKFWTKVKSIVKHAGQKVVYMALLLYYVLKSPHVDVQHKVLIISALGYLICPVDLIPDAIPVVGFTDDFAALTTVYRMVKNNVTPEIEAKAKAKAESIF